MKPFLFLGLLVALPAAGFSETIYSSRTSRVYRDDVTPVRRATTVRTVIAPPIEVYRSWDPLREYAWDGRTYRWDGSAWVIAPGVVYGGRFGTSSALQDDVGVDNARDEVVVRTVPGVEVETSSLAIDVQRRLARRGYYHGPIDGIIGPGTRSAIADFEADNGLPPDGLMTRQVIRTLGL
jgi:hypothetical protein